MTRGLTPESPFSELSDLITRNDALVSVLASITSTATELIAGAADASISLVQPEGIRTAGATSDLVRRADEIQYEEGEGPCLSSIEEGGTFLISDMTADTQWQRFSSRTARETPMRALLAFVLRTEDGSVGALNVYSKTADAFDEDDVRIGSIFAAHAGAVIETCKLHARDQDEIDHLKVALESRDLIGRAKGILMEREKVTDEEAFALLRRASQNLNIKLREIAQRVAEGENAI